MRMNRSGRINLILLAVLLIGIALGALLLTAGETPSAAAGHFLKALGQGDTKTLTSLSYMGDQPESETEKQWETTISRSRHYLFAWRIMGDLENGNEAVVKLKFVRNAANTQMAYEEDYELPLVKVNGKWKVSVREISRDMFPALPR
jgi:hypothetical protein